MLNVLLMYLTVVFFPVCIQSYLFLLSSDYERSEWRESIQKLQKKGNAGLNIVLLTVPVLRKHCMLHLLHLKWFKLFTHCTTEKWKFVSVWSLCVFQTSRYVFWVLWSFRSWPAPVSSSELSTTFLWPATKTVRTSHTNIFLILVFLCLDAFCVLLLFFHKHTVSHCSFLSSLLWV